MMLPELLDLGVRFYDFMRAEHSERSARTMAEIYMRRKAPGLSADAAAVALADALARRASAKILAAERAIVQTPAAWDQPNPI